jgi:hypothetical protein
MVRLLKETNVLLMKAAFTKMVMADSVFLCRTLTQIRPMCILVERPKCISKQRTPIRLGNVHLHDKMHGLLRRLNG